MEQRQDVAVGKPGKWLNAALWGVQVLLAFLYTMAGFMKTFQPLDQLSQTITWAPAVPLVLVRFIGISELAAAAGLILPGLTRIQPRLTMFAGSGLTVIMFLASIFHVFRGEFNVLPMTLTFLALAGFVAWGRWKLTQSPTAGD